MNTHARLAPEDQMTIEEFLAFTATRPDEERWELIEGRPVMNPSPVQIHQIVASNIVSCLMRYKLEAGATWIPLLGVGTRVPISPNSLPQPDVYVQQGIAQPTSITEDAVVVFEILSRSNTKSDRAWRKRVYASVSNCQHYVTVSTKIAEIIRHDRADGWVGTTIAGLDATLSLPAIGASATLRDIYRGTPIT